MYLLKKGKWRIPKECINELIDYRSVEYIYEEDCRLKLTNGLFTDLLDFSSSFHVLPLELGKGGRMTEDEIKPELYGLIFFALLKKEFYPGAKQLVETGFVRIHHLLVGCQLLQEVANDWKTTNLHKENLTRLKEAFTHRALQITRCIYETEKKKKDQSYNELVENELGEPVGHAGRLLLNHGYLEDAIKTANKTFLEKDTVSKILNKIWYGEEKTSKHQVWSIIMLASVHLLVMPLLMISMETGPLKWCYKKYKLPVMKVLTQMLGYFALLVLYAYMLLFNLNKELSYMDMFIAGWMGSFFLNEIKQAFVSALRKRFKNYLKDSWNRLDWTLMTMYASGMILKFGDDKAYQDASQILLVVTFILLSIRILHMFSMSKFLGPKLVIIHKMFKDTFIFMVILTVIMLSYNVSFHSLLYPNAEISWKEMEKMMQNGYWMLFGELNLDRDTLKEPECTFNKTIYNSDAVSRCPTTLGLHVAPYLKAIYGLIAVILLLNLLIAIYSDTFEKVQQESEFHWSQLRNGFLEEFSVKTIFPIHLQLLELPFCLVHFIIWCAGVCVKRKASNKVHHGSIKQRQKPVDRETLNGKPMFVRGNNI
ncbi:Hypothetical predicted protein [Mytilus galloprovincialis]|uniref:Ion transport domain-containing protein n=2 Tax=Mytilus galloprovincialis TaxID=29158 RepID=A0A8B6H1C9_MYTGA|nr:Hypothetical predicted protein [Mytilus galloprovincialis]